jgi:Tfp pilus assembly protein PilO
MPRNFDFGKLRFRGITVKDPRVAMRIVIGILLAANLAAAVIAFKPFGGSAADLAQEQQSLSAQLAQMQARLKTSRQLVEKVQAARKDGDVFLTRYFMDEATKSAVIVAELTDMAKEAGIKMGQAQFTPEPIDGSDDMQVLTTQVGFDGTYANLTKFVNLVDKSPRFMIIENMQAAAPQQQGGNSLSVSLKIDCFVKQKPGAAS